LESFKHLGPFSDLVSFSEAARARSLLSAPSLTPARVRELLGVDLDSQPRDVQVDGRWTSDGVDGEEVSWSVGYGPRTQAWVLRPTGHKGPLPGVLTLHGHDSFKWNGKEKIADGPGERSPELATVRRKLYGGRAFATELARRGFTVLVHDAMLWGSRRFPADDMPGQGSPPPEDRWIAADSEGDAEDVQWYNRLAARHEHVMAKYCTLLGISLAGLVNYEDRIAAEYLAGRLDVRAGGLGCMGLSGGGCRTVLLQATSDWITAAVVAGMMSTYRGLLDGHVANHTWMLFPPALTAVADWPDVAATRAPSPLLVQYLLDDSLFSVPGMRAAHDRLQHVYENAGAGNAYVGQFYPGSHRFDVAMQEAAFEQLDKWLTAV
jgi:dienelactone hydrolase